MNLAEDPSMTPRSRLIRFRLRTMMVAVALLGLLSAAIVQTVRLERAVAREARIQAELYLERARAEANFQKARAAVDQMMTQVAEQPAAAGTQIENRRRELLE